MEVETCYCCHSHIKDFKSIMPKPNTISIVKYFKLKFSEDLKNRSIVSQSKGIFLFFKNFYYSEKYCEYIRDPKILTVI